MFFYISQQQARGRSADALSPASCALLLEAAALTPSHVVEDDQCPHAATGAVLSSFQEGDEGTVLGALAPHSLVLAGSGGEEGGPRYASACALGCEVQGRPVYRVRPRRSQPVLWYDPVEQRSVAGQRGVPLPFEKRDVIMLYVEIVCQTRVL